MSTPVTLVALTATGQELRIDGEKYHPLTAGDILTIAYFVSPVRNPTTGVVEGLTPAGITRAHKLLATNDQALKLYLDLRETVLDIHDALAAKQRRG